MDRRIVGVAVAIVGLLVTAGVGAGCASAPHATLRYAAGQPDEVLSYDTATFQKARGHKIQVILFKRVAAPVGEGDPDFEYVFLEIPDGAKYGWVKEDNVPAYRWVRKYKKDTVWQGTAGHSQLRLSYDSGQHLHIDFEMTLETVHGEAGDEVMTASLVCQEDVVRTQGLINRYGGWLSSILGRPVQPVEGKAPALKMPGGEKKPSGKSHQKQP